jgi:thiamine-phosphate pyrophosphorylase
MPSSLARILDANLNRAREGLRVGEELARLVLENAALAAAFKAARHAVTSAERTLAGQDLLRGRAVDRDPGAAPQPRRENRRGDWRDLARANLRRAEEALRVLEEVSKLKTENYPAAAAFKRLRFRTYGLEQTLLAVLPAGKRRSNHAAR